MADLTEDQVKQQEKEEFEFRARAEQEAQTRALAEASTNNNQPGEGAVNPEQQPDVIGKIVGGLQVPVQMALENPGVVAGAAGLYKTGQAVNAYRQGAATKLYADLNAVYQKNNHDIRQYENNWIKQNGGTAAEARASGAVPQNLLESQAKLGQQIEVAQSKLPGYKPSLTSRIGGAIGDAASRVGNVLGDAASSVGRAASSVAPTLTEAASTVGRAVAPVLRVATGPLGQGAMLALHSGELNTGEAQQMAQIHQFQNNFAKLPPAQQSAYYNLPRDKQIQVHAMLMNGQNPSSILGQTNALTSGYSQQLQQLSR